MPLKQSQSWEAKEVPLNELILEKCWCPDCPKIAVVCDMSGWKWCEEHLDQEKLGGLHAPEKWMGMEYYQNKIDKIFLSHHQQLLEEALELIGKDEKFEEGKGFIGLTSLQSGKNQERQRIRDLLAKLKNNG